MGEIFAPYKWEALFARWPDILAAFGTTAGISAGALVLAQIGRASCRERVFILV